MSALKSAKLKLLGKEVAVDVGELAEFFVEVALALRACRC